VSDHIYIFVVVPNHSGSTWLLNIISHCKRAVTFISRTYPNNIEGQAIAKGAHYPSNEEGVWTEKEVQYKRIKWDEVKKHWNSAWGKCSQEHKKQKPFVFVEKSPHNVMIAPQLQKQFQPAQFIIMVRDPYPTIEGVMRNNKVKLDRATRHWIRCMKLQMRNLQVLRERIWFRYEDLILDPGRCVDKIKRLVPELTDLDFGKKARAHSFEGSAARTLKDYNKMQVAKLGEQNIAEITHILREEGAEAMKFFGYKLMEERPLPTMREQALEKVRKMKPTSSRLGNREFLIRYFKKRGVGAEIGVWLGNFSWHAIKIAEPTHIHLIDPWSAEFENGNKSINGQGDMDAIFEECQLRMRNSPNVKGGKTEVLFHRSPSHEAVKGFQNDFFDWVYIDGNHEHEFVKRDLQSYVPKVRVGGHICGNNCKPVQKTFKEFKKDKRVKFIEMKNDQFIFERIA